MDYGVHFSADSFGNFGFRVTVRFAEFGSCTCIVLGVFETVADHVLSKKIPKMSLFNICILVKRVVSTAI